VLGLRTSGPCVYDVVTLGLESQHRLVVALDPLALHFVPINLALGTRRYHHSPFVHRLHKYHEGQCVPTKVLTVRVGPPWYDATEIEIVILCRH